MWFLRNCGWGQEATQLRPSCRYWAAAWGSRCWLVHGERCKGSGRGLARCIQPSTDRDTDWTHTHTQITFTHCVFHNGWGIPYKAVGGASPGVVRRRLWGRSAARQGEGGGGGQRGRGGGGGTRRGAAPSIWQHLDSFRQTHWHTHTQI